METAMITFLVSPFTKASENRISKFMFTLCENNLTVEAVESHIEKELNDSHDIRRHFLPLLFMDTNGYRVLINSNVEDFQQFLQFVKELTGRSGRYNGGIPNNLIQLEFVEDSGQLLRDTIAGEQRIRSWTDYRQDVELNFDDIIRIFELQISENDAERVKNKQCYSFINFFKTGEPGVKVEPTQEVSPSGILDITRISRTELMHLIQGGETLILPLTDHTFAVMKFAELPVNDYKFSSWQQQNDGIYKCDEMKIPVIIGKHSISYKSADGKNLFEIFGNVLKDEKDDLDDKQLNKEKSVNVKPASNNVNGTAQTITIPRKFVKVHNSNSDFSDDSESNFSLSFEELVTDNGNVHNDHVTSVDLPACFSSKMDLNSCDSIRAFIRHRDHSNMNSEAQNKEIPADNNDNELIHTSETAEEEQVAGTSSKTETASNEHDVKITEDTPQKRERIAEPFMKSEFKTHQWNHRYSKGARKILIGRATAPPVDFFSPSAYARGSGRRRFRSRQSNNVESNVGGNFESQPIVSIVPDNIFQMTSNVLKSVANVFGDQLSEKTCTARNFFASSSDPSFSVNNPSPNTEGSDGQTNSHKQETNAESKPEGNDDHNTQEPLTTEMIESLQLLREMGFHNRSHNIFLLRQYPDNIDRVIESLLNYT